MLHLANLSPLLLQSRLIISLKTNFIRFKMSFEEQYDKIDEELNDNSEWLGRDLIKLIRLTICYANSVKIAINHQQTGKT